MKAEAILILAQIALTFGRSAAMTFLDIQDRLANGQPVTKDEVLQWLKALNYEEEVPNTFLKTPAT